MNIKLLGSSPQTQSNPQHAQTLTAWVEAAFHLYSNYSKLTAFIDRNELEQPLTALKHPYIGQCPIQHVTGLVASMEKELKKLLEDMEQDDEIEPSFQQENYKKLAAHTIVLNRLNQQAQTRLRLMSLTND